MNDQQPSDIRAKIEQLFSQRNQIVKEIKQLQENCPHDTAVHQRGSSGGWEGDPYYWFEFFCYDCQKSWSHDQNQGNPHNTMRVNNIDRDERPEVMELLIKAQRIKSGSEINSWESM